MNETTERPQTQNVFALDRLRNRTDELELIILSLTIFALFSLPGLMFEQYASVYTHLSASFIIASAFGISLLSGFCYALGACFIVHLLAHAYWLGLIGLRTTFPNGIQWARSGSGPLTREHYRRVLPNSNVMIDGTDEFASSLFAVISMITLGALWSYAVILLVLVPLGTIRALFGATNTAIGYGQNSLLGIYVAVPFITFLLDRLLAGWMPTLPQQTWFRRLIALLRGISKIAYPGRLIQPVKLTLQSNTQPLLFTPGIVFGAGLIIVIGLTKFSSTNFSLLSEFEYFDASGTTTHYRSTYYEDTKSSIDRRQGGRPQGILARGKV